MDGTSEHASTAASPIPPLSRPRMARTLRHLPLGCKPVSRRDQIKLSAEEQEQLLADERVVIVSSLGPRGWPHSMPMWFTVRDGEIWIWTYAKSQKVKNLERDPRATLLVETGEAYVELRGIQIEAE